MNFLSAKRGPEFILKCNIGKDKSKLLFQKNLFILFASVFYNFPGILRQRASSYESDKLRKCVILQR